MPAFDPDHPCKKCGVIHEELTPGGVACCQAHARTGRQCGRQAMELTHVCDRHGGKAPPTVAHVAEVRAENEARADLRRLGIPIDTTPVEALQQMLDEAAGNVVALRHLVGELEADRLYGRIKSDSLEAKPHVLVTMYGEERDRLARIAKDCAVLGLDERKLRLLEGEVDRLFTAVTKALGAIPADFRDAFRAALAAQLRQAPDVRRALPPG